MTQAVGELKSRLTVAALVLMLPTVFFWVALVLREGFHQLAPFDSLFLPLDRTLVGKLVTAILILGMPSLAAACAGLDLLLRWRQGRGSVLDRAIFALSALSILAIVLHGLIDP